MIYLFVAGNSKSQIPNPKQIQNPKSTSTNRPIVQSTNRPIVQSTNHQILLKGILNTISSIWVVGNNTTLEQKTWLKPWWSSHAGLIEIEIPADVMDEEMTVVAVQLDGK